MKKTVKKSRSKYATPAEKTAAAVARVRVALEEAREAYAAGTKKSRKISVSDANDKMGPVPSISFPPVITCHNCAGCSELCYALHHMAGVKPNIAKAYARNLVLYQNDPAAFWMQARAAVVMSRFFRFTVSGDIVDPAFFSGVVDIAKDCSKTEILIFTKNFSAVNNWITEHGALPDNLHCIFSAWGEQLRPVNPYNLPVAEVVFAGQEPREEWKVCGGNCSECACRGLGCWTLQHGETVCFNEH